MREKIDSGTVIAVDVSPPVDLAENPDYGEHISGWRILWNRLNPLARPLNLPSIAVILQRAAELSSKRAQRRLVNARLADLYICPPVEQFSMMDSRAIDEMVTIACEAAGQQIGEWLAEDKRHSFDPGNGRMAGRQAP
jgi:predicted acylesterase/phospholipase RssA